MTIRTGVKAKRVIMAIDDETKWLEVLCMALNKWDYTAVCVPTAKEALELFPSVRPFLVLTDLQLTNHIDGATMASKMHLQDPMCIFIAISGLVSTWDLGFLLGSVFTDVLNKPVSFDTLKHVVDYAWEKRQRWEQLI
jgi:DNA-binding NtrC family response regulator